MSIQNILYDNRYEPKLYNATSPVPEEETLICSLDVTIPLTGNKVACAISVIERESDLLPIVNANKIIFGRGVYSISYNLANDSSIDPTAEEFLITMNDVLDLDKIFSYSYMRFSGVFLTPRFAGGCTGCIMPFVSDVELEMKGQYINGSLGGLPKRFVGQLYITRVK